MKIITIGGVTVLLHASKVDPITAKYFNRQSFLNQARAWFLRIVSVRMYACVCVRPRGY